MSQSLKTNALLLMLHFCVFIIILFFIVAEMISALQKYVFLHISHPSFQLSWAVWIVLFNEIYVGVTCDLLKHGTMNWYATFIFLPLPDQPWRTPVPAGIVTKWKQPRSLSHLLDESHTRKSSKLHQTLSMK